MVLILPISLSLFNCGDKAIVIRILLLAIRYLDSECESCSYISMCLQTHLCVYEFENMQFTWENICHNTFNQY